MANKFTKGILERQEREYKKRQTAAPEPEIAEPSPPCGPAAPAEEKISEKTPEPAGPAQLPADLDSYIIRDGGRKAKNKTFYLDGAVIQAVKRAAAAQRVAESKLVNDILKKVLLP